MAVTKKAVGKATKPLCYTFSRGRRPARAVVSPSGPGFAVADCPILRHRLGAAALLSVGHRLFNAMQLTLIIPELIWPEPDDRDTLDGLGCPALTTVIARGRRTRQPPLSGEATLCGAFGLGENVAYAPLRALGEERPLDPADTPEAHERNRRIEFHLAARARTP